VFAQSGGVRYKDKVFDKADLKKNVSYGTKDMPRGKDRDHLMDIYQPKDDSEKNRPVIIWLHGGGFKLGKKTSRGIPLWCNDFAKRGYVSIAMNYRKGKGLPKNDFRSLAEGCFVTMEDINQVINYCRINAAELGIDTSKIILGGNSAGSMAAIQFVYSNENKLAAMGGRSDSVSAKKPYNAYHVSALINFWGAIFDSTWLKNAKVPIVSVQGEKDGVVPFNFQGPINGAAVIHREADKLGIPNALKSYPSLKHELQNPFHPFLFGANAKRRWHEAGDSAAAFLWDEKIVQ
jgi:acetyl esterase/lipase